MIKGVKFKLRDIIALQSSPDDMYPSFCVIRDICQIGCELKSKVELMQTSSFDAHLDAFMTFHPPNPISDTIYMRNLQAPVVHVKKGQYIVIPNVGM